MKRHLWIVPALLALPAWGYGVMFLLTAPRGGMVAQTDQEMWLTLYLVIAIALSITSAALHPSQSGSTEEAAARERQEQLSAGADEPLQEYWQAKQ